MVGNIGLHKGAGLGLLCELLGGALAGGTTMHPDSARRDRGGACTNNMMVICFTADRLGEGGTAAMMAEASRTLAYVKSSRPLPSEHLSSQDPANPKHGGGEVLLPGEVEARLRANRLAEGVPLSNGEWAAVLQAAASVGLARDTLEAALIGK